MATILNALKEEATDEILSYMQDYPEWRTETDLLTYKNNMFDTLFEEDKFRRVVPMEKIEEIRAYVVEKEQNEDVEKAETGLDFFNSAWRFIAYDLVWEEWDSLVEQVNKLVNN